jgi:hypothetical protein
MSWPRWPADEDCPSRRPHIGFTNERYSPAALIEERLAIDPLKLTSLTLAAKAGGRSNFPHFPKLGSIAVMPGQRSSERQAYHLPIRHLVWTEDIAHTGIAVCEARIGNELAILNTAPCVAASICRF